MPLILLRPANLLYGYMLSLALESSEVCFFLQSVWGGAIVLTGIYTGMFGTLFALFFLHSRQRDSEREKRLQYWREQVGH